MPDRTQRLVFRLTLLFSLLFGFGLAAASATTITLSAAQIPNIQAGAGTYELRIWLDRTMVDSLGVTYPGGAVDSPNGFKRVSCALASTTVTCDTFTLASTIDAQEGATAKYTAKLYRNNAPLLIYNKPFALPASLGASVTWEQIWRYNNTAAMRVPDTEYYTKNQVNALYAGSLFANPATTTSRGVGKSSMNVADPVFVETTDPRLSSADSVYSAEGLGLVGDGTTNNTTALVAGLNTVCAAGGGVIQFSGKTFKFTSQAVWPAGCNNVTLQGVGTGGTQLFFDVGGSPSTTQGLYINNASSAGTSKITFRDMTVRGRDDTDASTLHLIEVGKYVYDLLFDHVEFKWARGAGLRFAPPLGFGGARYEIRSCYFHDLIDSDSTTSSGAALLFGNINELTVSKTRFSNCGWNNATHAMYGTGFVNYLKVLDSTFTGANTRIQTYGDPHNYVTLDGNTFNGSTQFLYELYDSVVSTNIFIDAGVQLGITRGSFVNNHMTASTVRDFMAIVGNATCLIGNNDFTSTDPSAASSVSHAILSVSPTSVVDVIGNRSNNVTQFALLQDLNTGNGWRFISNAITSPYASGSGIEIRGGSNHVIDGQHFYLANNEGGVYVRSTAGTGIVVKGGVYQGSGSFVAVNAESSGKVRLKNIDPGAGGFLGLAPTIAAGAGAGTSPTVSVAGTDEMMTVTVTTGTTPGASATVVTVTYNTPYPAAQKLILTPANANAAALSGTGQVYIGTNAAGSFTIDVGSTNLTAATQYKWNVRIEQ